MPFAPVISAQIAQITENAPGWLQDLQRNETVQQLDDRYAVIDKVETYVTEGDFGQQVFGGALGVGLAVLSAVANAFIVVVLMVSGIALRSEVVVVVVVVRVWLRPTARLSV